MRFVPLLPALLAVSLAAPTPQEVNFAEVDKELPEQTRSVEVTAKPTIISFDPTAAIESVAEATHTDTVLIEKREVRDNSGCGSCERQPTLANHYNVDLSTDSAFLSDSAIASVASGAPTPAGYSKIFTNLQASTNGYVYMGYQVVESFYTPQTCADRCNSMSGCAAFNIFFERNPTVDACSSTCQDPPAFANIKCTYWGGPLTQGSAKNTGQWRNHFHVVIAGSNAYVRDGLPEVPGYSTVQSLGAASINAPRDCNGVDTYMTYKLFTNTPFDIRLCAAACDAETAYALAHPPATGKPRLCNFWNTYLLDRNGESQGQYCSLYTEPWDNSFATNVGQWRDNDHYTISASYSSYNLSNPGFPVCPSDIAYLNEEGAEFCTSYNAYVAPHTTTNVVGTTSVTSTASITDTIVTTPATSTTTVTTTSTVHIYQKRGLNGTAVVEEGAIETFKVIYPAKNTADVSATITTHVTDEVLQRRAVATPASITGWDAARISEACSAVATGTITDTVTTSVSTVYVATITDTATAYSEAPTPISTVTETATTTIRGVSLSSPTPIAGSLQGAPYSIDDTYYQITLPFPIGAFGTYSTNIFVSTNGVVMPNQGSAEYYNDGGIPAQYLPDVAILGLWDDLYIYGGTQQGMYYEVSGVAPHRIVTFEIYESAYQRSTEYYHFSMTFYEDRPGVTLFKYFTVSRNGDSATVGAQKKSAGKTLLFSHNQPNIRANLWVQLDTEAGVITSGNL